MNGSVAFGAVKQYVEEIIGGTPSIFGLCDKLIS